MEYNEPLELGATDITVQPSLGDMASADADVPKVVLSEAQRALVVGNVELVGHVVFQVAVNFPRHVDRDELKTAGALGLVEAASRFDESRGIPFDRFAATRIRGAILDQVRGADWAPRSVRSFARRVEAVEQRLATELGDIPTEAQIAEAMEMSVEELRRLKDKGYRSVVLALEYDVNDGDEDLTLSEVLTDPDQKDPLGELEERELRSLAVDAAKLLPHKQRCAIIGYFLEGKSSADTAKELGVTESRVSQLRSEGIEMIRHIFGTEYADLSRLENGSRSSRIQSRLGVYADRVAEESTWEERLDGPDRAPRQKATPNRLAARRDINRRGTVVRDLNPAELRKVFGYFLLNDNSRLEELRRANPAFDYIDTARFARIRRRISRDLAARGIEIQWDTTSRNRGARYTIRVVKGGEELERLVYGNGE